MKRDGTEEIYDYNSYHQALKLPDLHSPVLIGHWALDDDGKQIIKLLADDDAGPGPGGEVKKKQ